MWSTIGKVINLNIFKKPSSWFPQNQSHQFVDLDRDGIADEVEEMLLMKFRPYYKFSEEFPDREEKKEENYLPTDALWQIKYAQIITFVNGLAFPLKTCGSSPDYHADPPEQLLTCTGGDTDITKNPAKTSYMLNFMDDKRPGLFEGESKNDGWRRVRRTSPGLYGHVVPEGNTGLYKIEYWQFFAYNGCDIHGGDHEGDWCTIQLWYNPATKKLVKTNHYAHGKSMSFDLLENNVTRHFSGKPSIFSEYRGSNYDTDPGNLKDDPDKFQDNTVEFYVDENDFEHVVVYLERDSHEFWPTMYGSWPAVNEHNGAGEQYLTAYNPDKPLNLGEVENPLSEEARVILRFNGTWGFYHHEPYGSSPPGPSLHKAWTWPRKSVESGLRSRIDDSAFE
jgi:hypothetical protein